MHYLIIKLTNFIYLFKQIYYYNKGGIIIKQKIILATLLLFVLVSLTAVSAVDINQTDDIVADNSDSITQDILTDSAGDFKELNNSIAGATETLELTKNYTYNSSGDLEYKDGIKITSDITIDGKGYTIDGNHQSRIFNITDATVTLKNINFINAYSNYGGAICCEDANLTIIACNFSNNVAYSNDTFGGAVDFEGERLIIDNSKFISNKAYDCGALIVESTTAKITNTEFSENEALGDEGAAGVFSDNVLIDNCTFYNNYARESVGALYLSGNATVNNTVFERNRANRTGILFYQSFDENNVLIVNYCQFLDNDGCSVRINHYNAKILNSRFFNSTSKDGRAIYNGVSNTLYLSNNTLSEDNSVIYSAYGGDITSQVTVTILNNRTVYNHLNESILVYLTFSDDNGNLIQVNDFDLLINNTKIEYIYNDSNRRFEGYFTGNKLGVYNVSVADLYLSNLTFKNGEIIIVDVDDFSSLQNLINNANSTLTLTKNYTFNPLIDVDLLEGITIDKNITIEGAGFTLNGNNQASIFYVESGNVFVNNITFINGSYNGGGGAIFWEADNGQISNCAFINNHAKNGGAVEWIVPNGFLLNCTFMNNHAEDGGAVYSHHDFCKIVNCTFINNSATNGGAVEFDNGKNYSVVKSTFINNSASTNGGAIYLYTTNQGFVHTCSFSNNSAANGGAVFWGLNENAYFLDNNFVNNTAERYGGAISGVAGNISVFNNNFTKNTANDGGGAIGVDGNIINFANCNFDNNSAIKRAGAFLIYGLNHQILNSTFTNNTARDGAGIFTFARNFTVSNASFIANNVSNAGGAVYVGDGNLFIKSCNQIINNTANIGGAIYILNNASLITQDVAFINNTAEYDGGAICSCGNLTVSECHFTNNYAGQLGGAINGTENITVINSNFTLNEAYNVAGAIFVFNNATIDNCNFINNTAASSAGAVLLYNNSKITNSTFANNFAERGGALVAVNSNISNSNFTSNNAEDGGAVFGINNLIINNCKFASNAAEFEGGAIKYNSAYENSTLSIIDSLFDDNNAEDGGAAYLNNATATIVGTEFNKNNATNNGGALLINGNVSINGSKFNDNFAGNGSNEIMAVGDSNVVISKEKTEIIATGQTYVITYGGNYSVTLKEVTDKVIGGKTVSLTLNGKTYNATTDSQGVAVFSLTSQMLESQGTKTVFIGFEGDTNFYSSNATVNIVVKKDDVKILKAKKNYKFKKSKKAKNIKITLKDSKNQAVKNVKITIKLSGKKIKGKKSVTAKSNNEGVVTFKLAKKLTKKTKVKYTITFKGDNYYNKVVKKGNIKIK